MTNLLYRQIYFVSYTARHPRQTKNGWLLFIFRNIKVTATPHAHSKQLFCRRFVRRMRKDVRYCFDKNYDKRAWCRN